MFDNSTPFSNILHQNITNIRDFAPGWQDDDIEV